MSEQEEIRESGKTEEEANDMEVLSGPDPRTEAMAAVIAASNEGRDEAEAEFRDDSDPLEEEEYEEEAEIVVDTASEMPNNPIIERDGNQFIKLTVNGQSKEMPLDAALGALQRNENADQRLWEANQTKQEYDNLIAQHTAEATLPDANSETAVDTREQLNDALTKVYDGDVEEAADLIANVINRQQPKSQPVDVSAQVTDILDKRDRHNNLKAAFARFKSNPDFEILNNDDTLLNQVNTFTEVLQTEPEFLATNPSFDDYFTEAGNRTKNWLEKASGVSLSTASVNNDSRLERKRLTPSQPTSRTVRRGPKPDEKPFAKSRDDIVKDMARGRGQTNL